MSMDKEKKAIGVAVATFSVLIVAALLWIYTGSKRAGNAVELAVSDNHPFASYDRVAIAKCYVAATGESFEKTLGNWSYTSGGSIQGIDIEERYEVTLVNLPCVVTQVYSR